MVVRLFLPLVLTMTAACSNPAGVEWVRQLGFVDVGPHVAALVVPDTVTAGVTFPIKVTTIGNGCTRADGAEVIWSLAEPQTLDVLPYDRQRTNITCPDIAVHLPREVLLRFDEPGAAVVRVYGRDPRTGVTNVEARLIVRE